MLAIDAEFEVQVRPGRPPRGAHRTDVLPLRDGLALLHVDAVQVRIHGDMLVAVLDIDHVAKAILNPSKVHHAVTHGAHRGACRSRKIGPQVGTPLLQNGVKAHGKAAGYPGKLQRRGQVGAALALTVERVIGAFVRAGLLEPQSLVGFAVVDEFCAEHTAGAQGLAIGHQGFVHDRETVALAQGTSEVDVSREQLGQLHGHAIRDVGRIRRGKQRAVDDAPRQARGGRQRRRLDARNKTLVGLLDHQALEVAAVVMGPTRRQALQAVVVAGFGRHQASSATQQIALHQRVTAQKGRGQRIGHTHALQE